MSSQNPKQFKNLDASTISLQGKHLIEASAGTGKTHNITRIYLRLLLEKNIPIERLLVMTFTKDATEELRGRIGGFIRDALHQWDQLIIEDEYFKALACVVTPNEAKLRLKQALLFIDEAAIFTIHGFCKKVLSQHAFSSGLPFNLTMESDCQEWLIEACEDWYRTISVNNVDAFNTIVQVWSTPTSFIQKFAKAIGKHDSLDVIEPISLLEHLSSVIKASLLSLEQHDSLLQSALIEVKKGADKDKRIAELSALTQWIKALNDEISQLVAKQTLTSVNDVKGLNFTAMPAAFIDGRRFGRSAVKDELKEAFAPLNQLKSLIADLKKQLIKTFAFKEARKGIYHIRKSFAEKKQSLNLLSFDDLISTLVNKLSDDPDSILANAIYKAYPVALVDEFQDTDPQQFTLLKTIYYPQAESALYMIGDPKQAIYGFRGGDVFAYLSARDGCDHQWVMDTNWRSTPEMIQGYNRLFYGNAVTDKPRDVFGINIPYVPVNASPKALERQATSSCESSLSFVNFSSDEPQYALNKKTDNLKQNFREVIAQWCAQEIVTLLNKPDQQAHDIAILVRDSAEARDIKTALEACNVQSVFMSNRANLLLSEQTQHLLLILKGILFVEDERKFSAALTSPLLNIPYAKFVQLQGNDLAWQSLKYQFIQLREQWQQHGFMSMAVKLMHDHFSLSDENRDRALTNVLHIFELLQKAMQKHRQPQELLQWFEHQISLDNPEVEAELRLESDDNLIRIITQHGSKGLEYPIVFIPYATRHKNPLKFGSSEVSFIEYHDQQGKLQLSLDGSTEAKRYMAEEAYAESIRLLYVAVTRAELTCYICSAPFEGYENSPLGKTLKWAKEANINSSLQQLHNDEPQAIRFIQLSNYQSELTTLNQESKVIEPIIPTFLGRIERDWWLSSFSALSRNLTFTGLSRPDRDVLTNPAIIGGATEPAQPDENQIRFTLVKGAHTGNFLHDVLEHSDFTHPHWASFVPHLLTRYNGLIDETNDTELTHLVEWLDDIITTDIGGVITDKNEPQVNNNMNVAEEGSFSLSDLPLSQTLREREFYFPMQAAKTHDLLTLLKRHRYVDVDTDSQSKVSAPFNLPNIAKLKGMMHGFIDLMFCHNGKYYISDYKSNYLGDNFADYHHGAMRENIETHHYDLQYLIYTLALHRHLQLSLADYDPDIHLGGVVYLYLRGMSAKTEHKGAGVYYRAIKAEEILALDQLFQGETCHE